MVLMYLNEEENIYIEDYLYKPIEGKHTLIVKNDRNTPIEVTINRKVNSLDINKVYNHRVNNNSSYEFDFPIDDTIPPDILSLFIDKQNMTYENSNDVLNVPYIVPEGNDNINPVVYNISANDSFSSISLAENIEFIPDSNSVDGITELWYKFDNNENNLPNYRSGKLEKITKDKIGSLLYSNDFKYSELYLHLFSRDGSGNTSEENIIPIDIEVPSFVTDGFKINDTELYEGIELDSFNSNTLFDFSQVKTTRDINVYYDIQLVSVNKDTKEEQVIGKEFNKTPYPGTIDFEFTPINIDNDLYTYYVNIRTSNGYGRSLGFSKSPNFSFKVKEDFNVDYIEVDESPIVAFDADGSPSINSKDKTLVIGYSGFNTRSLYREIEVEFRYRDTRDKNVPASTWRSLKTLYLGTENGEVQVPFDTAILDPDGFKIYDFQVSKKSSEDSYIRKTKYDLMADSHVVNDEQTSNYFTAIKIPIEVLRNMNVQVQELIQGETFTSEKISIDNDLTSHSRSRTDAYFIALNKFETNINMSNYDDMDYMRSEIRSVINTNNFKQDVNIIRPYDETMESYVVFERGNVELNRDFWDTKTLSNTDSPFIGQYKNIETNITTFIGNEASQKVILKDDYRLYRKKNLPVPEIATSKTPEIVTEEDGSESIIFTSDFSISSSNKYGLETVIDYEYDDDDPDTPTDLFTGYTQGSLLEDAGFYNFTLRTSLTYGLETFYSEPNLYKFQIIYEGNTFREPVFREIVGSDGKITLTLETNTNDPKYSYKFIDSTNDKDITSTFTKYDTDTENIKYKRKIDNYGIYYFTVQYTNGIFEDELSTVVIFEKPINPDSSISGILNYHKSTNTKLSNRYNNAYLQTKVNDVDDRFYVVDIDESGTKSKLIVSSGYVIPFYDPATLNMVEAVVTQKYRDHIHDPNSRYSSMNPTDVNGKGHKVSSKDTSKVERVDSDLTPDKPIIRLFSEDPIEGSFNEYPKENDTNIVMGGVEINVTNGDANWETEIMINGEKFKDTNTLYEVSGNHKIVAIFRDRFNYTMNYATANINIKKDYLYSPINMDLYSLKDEISIPKPNLLKYGGNFKTSDLDEIDIDSKINVDVVTVNGKKCIHGIASNQPGNLQLKLKNVVPLKPNTTYIYSMRVKFDREIRQTTSPVHYHWYDTTAQNALDGEVQLVSSNVIPANTFTTISLKAKTKNAFSSDNPYFRWFLYALPEGTEFWIESIKFEESNEPTPWIDHYESYTLEQLKSPNNTMYSSKYLVDVRYFFITNKLLSDKGLTGKVDSEETLCVKKQYRVNNDNWTDYTDSTRIIVGEASTIEARKVMIDGTVIRESMDITPDMLGYNLPIPPLFIGTEYNNKEEGYSYFPVVEKNMGHSYRLELNGKPFEFGVPVLSNGSVQEYENYEITAYSKHYKFPDREAKTTINFRAMNKPPEKPYLKGIQDKEINHITDKYFRLELKETEENVQYMVKINDRIVNIGDYLFEEDDYRLNGVFIITVIAKNKLGLTSYNAYYIDNNRNVADDYHEFDYERNALILNSRDKRSYEFNNEMIMDLRTGDISYTDDKGNLIDVTAKLKERLNYVESDLNNININSMIMRGNISLLLDELSYIVKNNNFLEDNLKEAIDKLENIENEVKNSDKLIKDIEALKKKVEESNKMVTTLSKSVSKKTTEINTTIKTIEREIISTLPVQRDNISMVAKSYYNIKSVDLTARTKISKTAFNNFKKKYERFLTNVKTYIRNF
ncbi:hypothetical protein CPT_MarsHill_200 [Staphylococcus phage MarsHill]|nr:hypothetical protein CPT_MarsHill_200 [Staphylococcus phage MarsHill]